MKRKVMSAFVLVPVAVLGVTLSLVRSSRAQTVDRLYGTWRLMSEVATVTATGEPRYIYGKMPHGFISYGRDGRMLALGVSSERPVPATVAKITDRERVDLFNTMFAYGGTFTFDGKDITHHVDVSYNEVWTGMNLLRHVRFEGDRLTLTTDPTPSPLDGKMVVATLIFEKVK
jgi:hypothetical protein